MSASVLAGLSRLRNIGISAHIDSGKTTLTERMLFYTGKIHRIAEVRGKDGVGATMDFMELERERGITIQSAATFVEWDCRDERFAIDIIDTPGHVDFTIEVERALRALDGAILVLCSVGGVQSQSITVDRQMRRNRVPRLAFINKMDRPGADVFKVTGQLRDRLGLNAVLFQVPIGGASTFEGVVNLLTEKALYFDGDRGEIIREEAVPADLQAWVHEYRNRLVEALADLSDEVAEYYLEGEEPPIDLLRRVAHEATVALKLCPVFCGSAYKDKGVQPLLDAVCDYLPNPTEVENHAFALESAGFQLDHTVAEEDVRLVTSSKAPLCALAFKLEDGLYGQLTYVRIYQGSLTKGDWIWNSRTAKKSKVGRLVRMHASDMIDVASAEAGEIVALFGIDCASGDTFCGQEITYSLRSMFVPDPVISLSVEPKDKKTQANFSKALGRFCKEDPTFHVHKDEESGQTLISGMGELHLEVYVERMRREYKVAVLCGRPQVRYRETITGAADFDYTHKKQTGGRGQYARVQGHFEPTEEADFVWENKIVGGAIPREYWKSCESGFTAALEKGPLLGVPVQGVKVTLSDGNTHAVDSSDAAFQTAARMALRQVLPKLKPAIREPIMKVQVESPEDFQGAVLGDLNRRRGIIVGTFNENGIAVIDADVPLREMFGYATDLRSATQGKAEFTMEFARYAQTPQAIQQELIEERARREAEAKKKN